MKWMGPIWTGGGGNVEAAGRDQRVVESMDSKTETFVGRRRVSGGASRGNGGATVVEQARMEGKGGLWGVNQDTAAFCMKNRWQPGRKRDIFCHLTIVIIRWTRGC